ncbi:MAG: beta-propeller fold lactonase family protein [Anaerolineae bacterium]
MKIRTAGLGVLILAALLAVFGSGALWAGASSLPEQALGGRAAPAVEPQARPPARPVNTGSGTAGFAGSRKDVNRTQALRGDVLTYTIVLSNSGSISATVRVTDTMPSAASSALLFFPANNGTVLFPGGTGSFGLPGSLLLPNASDWVWTGVVSPNTRVVLTLRVELQTDLTNVVTFSNRVDINDGLGNITPVTSPETVYDPTVYFYIPIIMKSFPPPPTPTPNVACAPTRITDINTGNTPRGLVVDLKRNRLYVTNENGASVAVVDGHSNAVINTITGTNISAPTAIAFDAASDLIWVAGRGSSGTQNVYWVAPITASTFQVGSAIPLLNEPTAMTVNPKDKNLYVAHRWNDSVSVISPATRQVINQFAVGQQPAGMAAHSQTGWVYVANFASDDVSVLDVNGVLATISVTDSREPFGVAIDQAKNYIYVTTVETNRIVAINGATNQVLGWEDFWRKRQTGDSRVPLRALALNPNLDSGGNIHLWALAAAEDAITEPEQYTQVLLIPKGYPGFDFAVPDPVTPGTIVDDLRGSSVAINPNLNRVYVNLPNSNLVRVLADSPTKCFPVPFKTGKGIVALPGR